MRTPVLATLLSLSLIACAGQIGGTGGDDDVVESCGNGQTEAEFGETCDDSNTTDGDGCSSTCTTEAVPRLDASIDRTTISTQLLKGELVTLTLTGSGGFSGPVNVTTSIVDGTDTPIPLLTVQGPTTINVADGQTVPTMFQIVIPSNATGTALSGTFKLDLTSTGGNHNLSATLNIDPTLIISYAAGTGATQNAHPVKAGMLSQDIIVKRGATVGYKNDDTVQHITHGGNGFPHETINATTGQPGATYSVPTLQLAPGTTHTLGCHSHDDDTGYARVTVE